MISLIDCHPVARSETGTSWLLLPNGLEVQNDDRRPVYFRYSSNDKRIIPEPETLPQWCQFTNYFPVTPQDLKDWEGELQTVPG